MGGPAWPGARVGGEGWAALGRRAYGFLVSGRGCAGVHSRMRLRSFAGCVGLALVFVWGGALCGGGGGGGGFFAGVGGAFVLAGGWALGYHSLGFKHFPESLKSSGNS